MEYNFKKNYNNYIVYYFFILKTFIENCQLIQVNLPLMMANLPLMLVKCPLMMANLPLMKKRTVIYFNYSFLYSIFIYIKLLFINYKRFFMLIYTIETFYLFLLNYENKSKIKTYYNIIIKSL